MPIVCVPVHIVMGMPMTVGMRMRVAVAMGMKIIGSAHGWSPGHAYFTLAVPVALPTGTLERVNFA